MRNAWALLAGVAAYVVLALVFGFFALGVGFMDEPSRTTYGYVIILVPLLLAGVVVGRMAAAHIFLLATALAIAALTIFLVSVSGPMPFILADQSGGGAVFAQAAYQFAAYLVVSVLGAWIGARLLKGTPA